MNNVATSLRAKLSRDANLDAGCSLVQMSGGGDAVAKGTALVLGRFSGDGGARPRSSEMMRECTNLADVAMERVRRDRGGGGAARPNIGTETGIQGRTAALAEDCGFR
eukprot:957683-Pleurochrysis_carterae.AAC.1